MIISLPSSLLIIIVMSDYNHCHCHLLIFIAIIDMTFILRARHGVCLLELKEEVATLFERFFLREVINKKLG